jgi:hypothetical protein
MKLEMVVIPKKSSADMNQRFFQPFAWNRSLKQNNDVMNHKAIKGDVMALPNGNKKAMMTGKK